MKFDESEELLTCSVECPVCYLNWKKEIPDGISPKTNLEKTCEVCMGLESEVNILERRLEIMDKASMHRLPETLRLMWKILKCTKNDKIST